MDGTDGLQDVLGPVRDIHVAALLEALAAALDSGVEVEAESVERDDGGRILRHEPLRLPCRRDLRLLRDGRWLQGSVPGGGPIGFAPVRVPLGRGRSARVATFDWSAADVRLRRGSGSPDWTPLRRWFLEWFQPRFGEESPDLLGVVHSLEGPLADADGWRFRVDLGSASVPGFAAMLRAFVETGCADIRVGETEDAL